MSVEISSGRLNRGIGIAVNTAVRAGIIGANVLALCTPAQFSLTPVFGDGETQSKKVVESLVVDTLPMMDAETLQVKGLRTGEELNPAGLAYLGENPAEFTDRRLLVVKVNDPDAFLSFQIVQSPSCFLIDIQKTDNTTIREPTQCFGDLLKTVFVIPQVGQVT